MEDIYKTIDKPSKETLFKEKSSKFFGYAFPVTSEEEIKKALESLQKLHPSARHYCYAWQLGTEEIRFRANDDGEPSNSAGMPIYGQLQAFGVTNILVVSVRYFGGTKLGVGGLISAYKTSAQLTLEASEIKEKTIDVHYLLTFNYDMMNKVQRIVKEKKLRIVQQKLDLNCQYTLAIRKKDAEEIFAIFNNLYKVAIKAI
ncbi:YigZ family protein [uncultured Polaribacter sp.]|uniref:IMPACT family protein n=1 Tax=uncultured Polaribacter sp. TaxID=174711 RepID=UPI00262633A6|nr:YigZ family protein [uncultured Polaribacter sp.]